MDLEGLVTDCVCENGTLRGVELGWKWRGLNSETFNETLAAEAQSQGWEIVETCGIALRDRHGAATGGYRQYYAAVPRGAEGAEAPQWPLPGSFREGF